MSNELADGVFESNLAHTAEEIMRLQDKFHIWGSGLRDWSDPEDILAKGFETRWGSLRDYVYELVESPDGEMRKKSLVHRLKDGYAGREVWVFFATPKGVDFHEVRDGRDVSNLETSKILYKYDGLAPGSRGDKESPHVIDPSRIVGYMDAYGQYHSNSKFDADKLAEEYKADGY